MQITAAVIPALGEDFTLAEVELREPGPGEVLVRIAAVGLCHTDLAVQHGHLPFPFPAVVGHEGAGVVEAIGEGVTKVAVGDPVAATFNFCGECAECTSGSPSYCVRFMELNFGGVGPDGLPVIHEHGTALGSNFFGQSSMATHAIAHEVNVVKLPADADLTLAGPLGCGIQTGAGAVLNALDCPPGSSLLVTGGGSVGLSAVMAAAQRGLATIMVSDPVAARRALALELGATHAFDPVDGPLAEQVRAVLPGGVKFAIDTTAAAAVVDEVIASLAQQGELGMLGVPADPTATLSVGLIEMQARGLKFGGIVEGNSNPDEFIPHLLDLHRQGAFPFEKLVSHVPFSKINDAIAMQAAGDAVKVVLVHE